MKFSPWISFVPSFPLTECSVHCKKIKLFNEPGARHSILSHFHTPCSHTPGHNFGSYPISPKAIWPIWTQGTACVPTIRVTGVQLPELPHHPWHRQTPGLLPSSGRTYSKSEVLIRVFKKGGGLLLLNKDKRASWELTVGFWPQACLQLCVLNASDSCHLWRACHGDGELHRTVRFLGWWRPSPAVFF